MSIHSLSIILIKWSFRSYISPQLIALFRHIISGDCVAQRKQVGLRALYRYHIYVMKDIPPLYLYSSKYSGGIFLPTYICQWPKVQTGFTKLKTMHGVCETASGGMHLKNPFGSFEND
jgi:hypothetical protein